LNVASSSAALWSAATQRRPAGFRVSRRGSAAGAEQVKFLNPGEVEYTTDVLFNPRGLERASEYWKRRGDNP